ncbi:hypothetical protein [Aquipuribacter hungaricus]|uniref:Uncharacterized protein n=1 Tax=Aquipuribacter hungaricus TaxID=545624 RepID=A0ABV7WGE7_9MICO
MERATSTLMHLEHAMPKHHRPKDRHRCQIPDVVTVGLYAALYLLFVDHRTATLVGKVAELSG